MSGMISSTRVKFKALLDYSSGVVDDEGGGTSTMEERKNGSWQRLSCAFLNNNRISENLGVVV